MTIVKNFAHRRFFNAKRHLEFQGYWIFFSIWKSFSHHKIRKHGALELWVYFVIEYCVVFFFLPHMAILNEYFCLSCY